MSPASRRGAPSRSCGEAHRCAPPSATSSIVPTRTRTMLRMKASAVIRKTRMSPLSLPARRRGFALEADVVGLGRGEGGEVVGARQGGGAGVERLAVDPVRPPERPAALERAGGAAPSAPGSGSCARSRRGGRRSRRRPARRSRRRRRGRPVEPAAPGRRAARPSSKLADLSAARGRRRRCARRRSARPAHAEPCPARPPARPAPCAGRAAWPSPRTGAVVFDVEPDRAHWRSLESVGGCASCSPTTTDLGAGPAGGPPRPA